MAKKKPAAAATPAVQYTAQQIADIRGCSKATINLHARRLIANGEITGQLIAQTMVYSQAEADRIIAGIRSKKGNPNFDKTGDDRPAGYGRWPKKES